jgi:hypothetical protein
MLRRAPLRRGAPKNRDTMHTSEYPHTSGNIYVSLTTI